MEFSGSCGRSNGPGLKTCLLIGLLSVVTNRLAWVIVAITYSLYAAGVKRGLDSKSKICHCEHSVDNRPAGAY